MLTKLSAYALHIDFHRSIVMAFNMAFKEKLSLIKTLTIPTYIPSTYHLIRLKFCKQKLNFSLINFESSKKDERKSIL